MHFQNTIVKQEHLYPQSILIATFSMKHVEIRTDMEKVMY
jgi:hypothetical protein